MTRVLYAAIRFILISILIPIAFAVLVGELFLMAALFFACNLFGKKSSSFKSKIASRDSGNSLLVVSR